MIYSPHSTNDRKWRQMKVVEVAFRSRRWGQNIFIRFAIQRVVVPRSRRYGNGNECRWWFAGLEMVINFLSWGTTRAHCALLPSVSF